MKPVAAGDLRHVGVIYAPADPDEVDEVGQPNGTPTTVASRFMSAEPLTGREYEAAQQIQAGITHKVKMRPIDNVTLTSDMWIVVRGKTLNIVAVIDPEERGIIWDVMCESVEPAA